MPSIRAARLCELRQKEVQQPIKLRHPRLSHANRRLRHRHGMLSRPSSPSCSVFKLDECITKQDLMRLHQSSCGYSLIKRLCKVNHLPQALKSPATHAKFSRHRARGNDHENGLERLHAENVCAYQPLRSSKRRLNRSMKHIKAPSHHAKNPFDDFRDANAGTFQRLQKELDSENDNHRFDGEVLVSGLFANQQFDANSAHTEMHVNACNHQTSVASSCFDKVTAPRHEYQTKRNFHPKSPNRVTYTTPMHNKSILPIVVGDSDSCNINSLEQEPNKKGAICRHDAMASIDSEHKVPISQGLMSSKQKASFPYDGIFYHKPKTRVNAPRRARKIEAAGHSPQHTTKHRHAAPRLTKKSSSRKIDFHDSHDSTTRLLPSHDGLELPSWISPLKSNVGPSQVEGQSLDQLARFAVHESSETTRGVMKCLKLAENINDEVSNSLNSLYRQGEQTRSAHKHILDIDHNLSAGEKLLGSFGGFFTKKWKPVKTRIITGPENVDQKHMVLKDTIPAKKGTSGRGKNRAGNLLSDSMAHMQLPWQAKVEIEEREQDEALTDLSNLVSELKKMSLDIGTELSRQTEGLDPFQDEVVELSHRLKKANLRGRFLLAQ